MTPRLCQILSIAAIALAVEEADGNVGDVGLTELDQRLGRRV